MHLFSKSFSVVALSLGMAVVPASVFALPANGGGFQYGNERYGDLRGLVERTQGDLREASALARMKGDQRERYDHAQGHLSTFDRHLTKGHFDKHELNDSISEVQKILDNNTLQASSRDALMRDVSDLRAAREHRY